jgi:fructokinase
MFNAESKNWSPDKIRKVFAVGETVWDIIFKNGIPLAARPGGAMLNTAISLGRSGIPTCFISEIGNDEPGHLIFDFLASNKVSTEYVQRYSDGKTAVALAFLDGNNNADYSFYKHYPKERLTIDFPDVTGNDIVLFGSFYAITREIHENLTRFIRYARKKKALIIYDPNFRKPHLARIESLRPLIVENISLADIVRGSSEDFLFIFGTENPGTTYQTIRKAGCRCLLCTRNKLGVDCYYDNSHFTLPAPAIIPESTIGAGDAFNAGVIYALSKENIYGKDLPLLTEEKWKKIAGSGIRFSTEVCLSIENYVSFDFFKTPGE